MRREGAHWTWDQTEQLAQLYLAEVAKRANWRPSRPGERILPFPFAAIAAELGRTVSAVTDEIHRRGIASPGAKPRSCLGNLCQGRRLFYSAGPQNGICQRCGESEMMRCA